MLTRGTKATGNSASFGIALLWAVALIIFLACSQTFKASHCAYRKWYSGVYGMAVTTELAAAGAVIVGVTPGVRVAARTGVV